jgi:uncharacterized protein (TIGR02453 family)
MIQPNVIKFLKDIKNNNSKAWFDGNRNQYEEAKASFLVLVDDLINGISSFDADIANLGAKECVFRINRDVRFSKDKRPYKNNMAAYFNRAGKKGTGAGYYLHIEPGNSFAAAGIWMPEPADLSKIRQEIDYNFDEWKKIPGNKTFQQQFDKGIDMSNTLVRPPKGYDEENPAIKFIKLKSFVATRTLPDACLGAPSFLADITKTFKAAQPLINFINRSLD